MHPESLVNHRLRRKTRRLPWRFASSSSLFDGSAESESGASVALLLEDLNPSQRSAVVQPRHSLVRVISGPGSGKTRVLTSRVAHLLLLEDTLRRERQQVDSPPREGEWVSGGILAVTFTRKAAGEMEERVRAMVGDDPARMSKVTLGTFHSICAKVLRWNGDLIGSLPLVQREASSLLLNATANNLDGSYVIVDEAEQFRIIKSCLDEAGISLVDSNIKPMTILSLLSEYKDGIAQNEEGENPFEKKKPGSSGPALSKAKKIVVTLYPLYREYLLRHNCLDFDDLIYYCRDLLLHHPDIRERLHRKWNHVLVDEFQDTSRSQLDLVKLWTSRSLMVVGDADQSIYSWRGAYVNSLSDFDKEFRAFGDVVTVFLMENYRSTSNIIMAAQKVISHRDNPDRATGADRLRQNMKPTRGKGPSPRVMRFQDDEDEGAL
jgi:DNA helicase-2/ATP-dependent DNA helicase PcrA